MKLSEKDAPLDIMIDVPTVEPLHITKAAVGEIGTSLCGEYSGVALPRNHVTNRPWCGRCLKLDNGRPPY